MSLWDPRISKFASLLVNYCIEAKEGEEVLISGSYETLPLLVETVRALAERNAFPHVFIRDELIEEVFFRHASEKLLSYVPKLDKFLIENIDATIRILAPTHTRHLTSIDPEKQRLYAAARREIRNIFLKRAAEGKLRWVVTAFPTRALAQEADMSFTDYAEFVFRAIKLHEPDPIAAWNKQAELQQKIADFLAKVKELRIVGEAVDLYLRVDGRKWINDDGKNNMPGGEVFTAPHEDSVEGFIEFEFPAIYGGRLVEGIKLVFRRGIVVEARALRGEDLLHRLLQADEGARRVGEFAFGLNYDITRFTREILFDEKIGGTLHLALGSAYPETGGKNVSSIHWDMIKDGKRLRVYADGDLVYENGKFLTSVL